jgi:hypothetical protein
MPSCLCLHAYAFMPKPSCLSLHAYAFMPMSSCLCLHAYVFIPMEYAEWSLDFPLYLQFSEWTRGMGGECLILTSHVRILNLAAEDYILGLSSGQIRQ